MAQEDATEGPTTEDDAAAEEKHGFASKSSAINGDIMCIHENTSGSAVTSDVSLVLRDDEGGGVSVDRTKVASETPDSCDVCAAQAEVAERLSQRIAAASMGISQGVPGSGDEEEQEETRGLALATQTGRRRRSLRRRLVDVLRGNLEVQVEVQGVDSADDGDEGAAEAEDGEEEQEEEGGDDNVVVLGTREEDNDSGSGSESHSEVDLPAFREQLVPGDVVAMTLWRSAVFQGPAELTGECALAVARWVEKGVVKVSELTDEMLLCIVRCLERGHAMFEEEEDLVRVFTAAVEFTEVKECVDRLLERGALRAMIRGLQSSAHLLLDLAEDTDWFETERLVRIYKAFKTLWQACCSRPSSDPQRRSITEIVFAALGKWLRSVPLQDVWIGEDDILVFWVLIPLWPHYLHHLEDTPNERATEQRGRFREICNWVLWPNDPVVESGYRLIGHLDFAEGADFSLRFLLSEERFRWIVTPATKQRYLQYRVSQVAGTQTHEGDDRESAKGLVLVVNRETPLQDLCRQLGVTGYGNDRVNLLGGITVHFTGGDSGSEEGIDEGGPWREAIPLMFSELISPNHGLFEVRDDGEDRTVEPRWCAADLVPDYQAQFELCGMLIGMALVYQAYAPAHFSKCFLKHLIGLPRLPEDVPSLVEQLATVSSTATNLDALCLTFSVDDATTGRTTELVPGGSEKAVTATNAGDYACLRTAWELDGRFLPVMPHVQRGLRCIVPDDVLEAFARMVSAEELDIMLAGHGINIKDWREHTEYYGYDECSDVIRWFWDAVEGFTAQEREDLWTFISGSKGVPPGGFGNLTNAAGEAIRFTIAKVEASPDHLPVAHTCGYQLDLAQYATAEDLANKLRHAMSHRQGFGLA